MKKVVVISVGGSIIVPGEVDSRFLSRLKKAMANVARKYRVVICTGGGFTARNYITALKKAGIGRTAQDWIGIAVTRLNAQLVSSYLDANGEIPVSVDGVKKLLKNNNVVVCGGLKPGRTSDGTTAEIAVALKAHALINVTNVKGLYDKDPRKHKDAKFIPEITHAGFAKMIAKVKEGPGQHFVLDSVAAGMARKAKMEVVILQSMENLRNLLEGKKFTGTVIKN